MRLFLQGGTPRRRATVFTFGTPAQAHHVISARMLAKC